MAWKRFRSHDENIDPFDAPDPVMPHEDPSYETSGQDDGTTDGSNGTSGTPTWAITHSGSKTSSRHPDRHSWHRQPDDSANESASPVDSHETDAAETQSSSPAHTRAAMPPADKRSAMTTRERKATSGCLRGCFRGCLVVIIVACILFALSSTLLASCTSTVIDIFDDSFTDSASYSSNDRYDDLDYADIGITGTVEDAALLTTESELDSLIAGEEPYLATIEEGVIETFSTYCSFTPEELGLDASEIALWILEHTSYELDDAYASIYTTDEGYEGTADVYFDISLPDVASIASNFESELANRGVSLYSLEAEELDTSLTQEVLADVLAGEAGEVSYREFYSYMYFDVVSGSEKSSFSLELDQDAWDEEVAWIARLF